MTGFKVVIPARYASTRLPGKPLADIAGKPMVVWVAEAARRSGAVEVWVATDDARVLKACEAHGVRALMTSNEHPSLISTASCGRETSQGSGRRSQLSGCSCCQPLRNT